jgi:hypothetical protein
MSPRPLAPMPMLGAGATSVFGDKIIWTPIYMGPRPFAPMPMLGVGATCVFGGR